MNLVVASEFPQVGLVQFSLGDPILIPPGVLLIHFASHAKAPKRPKSSGRRPVYIIAAK
jgi:hypothetical protein